MASEYVAQTPGAPRIDADDQQVSARAHTAGRFAQQTVGRQTEIQPMLQHHDIGRVLAQWPGLLLANDLDTRQRRSEPHIALHLRRDRRGFRRGAVMHQITAEIPPQFFVENTPFLFEQKLPQRPRKPFTGSADQCKPLRIGLSERFIGHEFSSRGARVQRQQTLRCTIVRRYANCAMIQIHALPAFNDNYIWLLQDLSSRQCAVVDPGDAKPVMGWLAQNPDYRLTDILITHHHNDHVGGVAELKQATRARVLGPAAESIPARDIALADHDRLTVLGLEFVVHAVPGHTLGHIAFYHEDATSPLLFSGDTLFAAGCGRLFEGTPQQMHDSLCRLAELPDSTLIYCAHEYTLSNLRFAQAVEPDNLDIAERLAEVTRWRSENRISLPSNLALEKRTNPFLRTRETSVKEKADERSGGQNTSQSAVFASLRAWKDKF
ncbi:Hydroxyacylglutathione hydrolase [Pseudomonas caricapapayae]|uniref:Hydroxyacylglutathione hydrolase n=1 Tax=Pseudomonas caricapapayae TaxID=46678 RepID=A0A0P9LZY7_9PSED|nr:Hydroxyacylglutathione hydrolase [Pseudomonas caricapapayae]RMM11699.1 Hydroxyacylglutathione hydrolase [Pseudomonas caricapapayae]RMV92012.1 Hydroxyacylglutathione hydrolase [Pseudomonas caricapapayae]